jgi:hypothetical protein
MAPSRRNVLFGIASLPAASLVGRRPLPGLTATVYNGHELTAAFRAAGAGSVITLAPGDFGDVGPFVLTGSDISLRVQTPLRTVLRSRMIVRGSLVELDGLDLDDGIDLEGDGLSLVNSRARRRRRRRRRGGGDNDNDNGNNNNNGNDDDNDNDDDDAGGGGGGGGRGPVSIAGTGNSVSNTEISGRGSSWGVSIGGSARSPRVTNNYIHHCNAAIGIGISMVTSDTRIGALVQGNRIEDCTGSTETIMVKASGNTITGNRLTNCNNVTNRHGESNTYSNNTMERCLCIVIHDRNNRVIGNRAVSPKLARSFRVMGGNIGPDSNSQGGHPQAVNTYLAGNVGNTLEIGAVFDGDRLPALNTIVASHSGSIRLLHHSGTRLPGGAGGGGDNDDDRA